MTDTQKGHPHAKLMAEFAEDARETDKPWEWWEVSDKEGRGGMVTLQGIPEWSPERRYRRKPRTITINGHEVPEPLREVEFGQQFFVPFLTQPSLPLAFRKGTGAPDRFISMGIAHTTREAAEQHARAILSFTEVRSCE